MKYIPSETGREIPEGKFRCPKCEGFGYHLVDNEDSAKCRMDAILMDYKRYCKLCDDNGYLDDETVLMDNGEYWKVKNIAISDILLTYDNVRGTFTDLMGYEWHRAPTRDTVKVKDGIELCGETGVPCECNGNENKLCTCDTTACICGAHTRMI